MTVRSTKGAEVGIVHSLGPNATVSTTVEKLETVSGTVTSSDVLMQEFYCLA